MAIDVFFDTNVVVYTLSADAAKAQRSERLLAEGGVVSVQVLNEIALVCRRKMDKSWLETREIIEGVRAKCGVVPLTAEVHELGLACAERYRLNVFDSMHLAAALLAGCTTLYSEDMHNGLVVDGLTIRNPYRPAGPV